MTTAGELKCADVLEKVDGWIDGELAGNDQMAVSRHLETCAQCSALVANRTQLRDRMRRLARDVRPDADLTASIRSRISADQRQSGSSWRYLAMAAAVLLTIATYSSWRSGHFRFTPGSQEKYIASITPDTAPIMRIGLKQHIHCAVYRNYPAQDPAAGEVARSLAPRYASLVPIMQRYVPAPFRVVMAHECTYEGKNYVHVIARSGAGLISLLITARGGGEAFENDLRAVAAEDGTSVYSSGVPRFSIAGFETQHYLVYLVSDLNQTRNLALTEAMTPDLKTTLL